MAADPALIDRAHLAAQTFEDADLAREVLGLFRTQMQRLPPVVRSAGAVEDRMNAAHTLKGSARGVGAARVAACAEACEAELRAGRDPSAALAALGRALDETDAALADYLRASAGGLRRGGAAPRARCRGVDTRLGLAHGA
jgi:HPt (histidine-containing phosphotransfer) domain-containing protein